MSYQSDNLDLEVLEEGDPADLTTVSDNFDKIDAVVGDIATVESSPTAAAHSVGEFLLYEGRLYKVTAAISAGGSLILGTNVSTANIGNELKSLQDSVGSVIDKGNINYNADLNSFTSEGRYFINAGNSTITNRPNNSSAWGILAVFRDYSITGCIIHLYFDTVNSNLYYRIREGNTWRSWYKVTSASA